MNDPKRTLDDLTARFTEAVFDVYGSLSGLSIRDRAFDVTDGYSTPLSFLPPHHVQNQKRGEQIPVYRTEAELRVIRDRSRILCFTNEFAISGVENRVNYVVGEGFRYSHPDPDAQAILDACSELNDLAGIEAEALRRADRDGEFFLRLFDDHRDPIYRLRFVEPEHVRAPGGDTPQNGDSYGVRVQDEPYDAETVLGYWIVSDPLRDNQPELVGASEVLHGKLNTDRSAKRGLPTFYPVESNLRRCEDLLASMTATAKTRAKVAMIRKLAGVTAAAAETLVRNLTEVAVSDPSTGATVNLERLRYGSVITAPSNVSYEVPQTNVGASDFVEVLQAELRAVGARLQMAEWMFTGRTDATYSNAFAAESPTLRSFTRLQRWLARLFGTARHGPCCSLLWRQLRRAVAAGLVSRDALREPITVTPPTLEVRDKARDAQIGLQYLQAKVWSTETVRERSGVDPEVEAKRIDAEAGDKGADDPFQMLEEVSGIFTDKAGRKYRIENGKRVPVSDAGDDAEPAPARVRSIVGKVAGAVKSFLASPAANTAIVIDTLSDALLLNGDEIGSIFFGARPTGSATDVVSTETGLSPLVAARVFSKIVSKIVTKLKGTRSTESLDNPAIELMHKIATTVAEEFGLEVTPVEELASRLASRTREEWQGPFNGPRGGRYWQNSKTGEKTYSDPGTGSGGKGRDEDEPEKGDKKRGTKEPEKGETVDDESRLSPSQKRKLGAGKWVTELDSSAVTALRYDREKEELSVKWQGAFYTFAGVSEEEAKKLLSGSLGQTVAQLAKSKEVTTGVEQILDPAICPKEFLDKLSAVSDRVNSEGLENAQLSEALRDLLPAEGEWSEAAVQQVFAGVFSIIPVGEWGQKNATALEIMLVAALNKDWQHMGETGAADLELRKTRLKTADGVKVRFGIDAKASTGNSNSTHQSADALAQKSRYAGETSIVAYLGGVACNSQKETPYGFGYLNLFPGKTVSYKPFELPEEATFKVPKDATVVLTKTTTINGTKVKKGETVNLKAGEKVTFAAGDVVPAQLVATLPIRTLQDAGWNATMHSMPLVQAANPEDLMRRASSLRSLQSRIEETVKTVTYDDYRKAVGGVDDQLNAEHNAKADAAAARGAKHGVQVGSAEQARRGKIVEENKALKQRERDIKKALAAGDFDTVKRLMGVK